VAELHADFNDQVKKGQLLARLDTQLFRSAVAQGRASNAIARANVSKAEAQLADAQRSLARGKALGAQNFLAQEQVDQASSAVDVARAALAGARAQAQQAAAQLQQAELNLEMTAIHSPIDGVVISRSVDVGQTVAASLQAPTIFTLAEDLRKMQVEAHVAESDVAKLNPGMPVSFTVDAFPGRKFGGTLRQVRNAAVAVQNVVTYDAIVDVDNPQLELRPGMTANVTFVVAERQDVLRIPNAALRFRPPTGARGSRASAGSGSAPGPGAPATAPRDASQKVVFTPAQPGDKAQVHPVRVRVGITDGSYTELLSGDLSEGASLVSDLGGTTAARPAQRSGQPGAAGPMGGLGGPGMGAGAGRRSGGF
jgi:HlyD family secretion protein